MKRVKREIIYPIGPSIAYVPLTRGLYATIEIEDAEGLAPFNWSAMGPMRNGSFYACKSLTGRAGKTIGMHSYLLHPAAGMVTDHKNGSTLDNRRRGNLREATNHQNLQNTRRPKQNTSGYKGVTFHAVSGRWRAQIVAKGKYTSLGLHSTKEQAFAAYCEAAREQHGEFARVA